MKKSKFTDSQIMEALKRAESGIAVPEICRELGISTATFYNWRGKYGGMDVSLMARMKVMPVPSSFEDFRWCLVARKSEGGEPVTNRTSNCGLVDRCR